MQVDTLMLVNSAEVRDGLLYALGGGWTRCWPESGAYPFRRSIGLAFAVRVDYSETNEEHQFRLTLRDSDELVMAEEFTGGFTVGRDPGLTVGMSQVVQIAAGVDVEIPRPGIYAAVLELNGIEERRITFEAHSSSPNRGAGA